MNTQHTATTNQSTQSGDPDLFNTPFSPPPDASPELDTLKREHPTLYKAYVEHIQDGYKNNDRIFAEVLRAFLLSHYSTLVMYWILFAVGVGSVVAAIVLGLVRDQVVAGAAFAGLSVVAFIGYFIGRSTQSVEENLIYITWLGVIYNSYWTYLAWTTKRESAANGIDQSDERCASAVGKAAGPPCQVDPRPLSPKQDRHSASPETGQGQCDISG